MGNDGGSVGSYDYDQLLRQILSHPNYSSWVSRGENDYRPSGKNPSLKLSTYGLYDHKTQSIIKTLPALARELGLIRDNQPPTQTAVTTAANNALRVAQSKAGEEEPPSPPNPTSQPSVVGSVTGSGERNGSDPTPELPTTELSELPELPAPQEPEDLKDLDFGAANAALLNLPEDQQVSRTELVAKQKALTRPTETKGGSKKLPAQSMYNGCVEVEPDSYEYKYCERYFNNRGLKLTPGIVRALKIRFYNFKKPKKNEKGEDCAGEIIIPSITPAGVVAHLSRIAITKTGEKFETENSAAKKTLGQTKDAVVAGIGGSFVTVISKYGLRNERAGNFAGGLTDEIKSIYVFEGIEDALTYRQIAGPARNASEVLLVTHAVAGFNRLDWWIDAARKKYLQVFFVVDPDSYAGELGEANKGFLAGLQGGLKLQSAKKLKADKLFFIVPQEKDWLDRRDINRACVEGGGLVSGGANGRTSAEQWFSNCSVLDRRQATAFVSSELIRQRSIVQGIEIDGRDTKDGSGKEKDIAVAKVEGVEETPLSPGAKDINFTLYEDHRNLMKDIFYDMRRHLFDDELYVRVSPEDSFTQIKNREDYIRGKARIRMPELSGEEAYGATHFKEYWEVYRQDELKPQLLIDIPEWDGRDRIREITDFIVEEDFTSDEVHELFRSWLVCCWLRVHDSEVENHFLILTGKQGDGKDVLIEALIGGFEDYSGFLNLDGDVNQMQRDCSRLIVANIAEVDQFHKSNPAALKQLISTYKLAFDEKYAVGTQKPMSRVNFIGSSNKPEAVLRDFTGNRRYWILKLDTIKLERRPGTNVVVSKSHYPGDSRDPERKESRRQILAQIVWLAENHPEYQHISNELLIKMQDRVIDMTPDDPALGLLDTWEVGFEPYIKDRWIAADQRRKRLEDIRENKLNNLDAFSGFADVNEGHLDDIAGIDVADDDQIYEGISEAKSEVDRWRGYFEGRFLPTGDAQGLLKKVAQEHSMGVRSLTNALGGGGYKKQNFTSPDGKSYRTVYFAKPQRGDRRKV